MTFLESLHSHKGGLIQLKTQLFWYEGRKWDNNPGRVCLILGAATTAADAPNPTTAAGRTNGGRHRTADAAAAHLLIDGQPAWIWVVEADVELL